MKKTACALSIGSTAIYGLSFIAIWITIIFQSVLVKLFFKLDDPTFSFPITQLFSVGCMLLLSCVALYVSIKGNAHIAIIVLLILLPLLFITPASSLLTLLQNKLTGLIQQQLHEYDSYISLSYVQVLVSRCTIFNYIANAAYFVCAGIHLANHRLRKATALPQEG